MGSQKTQLTGRNLAALLIAGVFCLTIITVAAMLTKTDGALLAGCVGAISACLAYGAGKFPLGGGGS